MKPKIRTTEFNSEKPYSRIIFVLSCVGFFATLILRLFYAGQTVSKNQELSTLYDKKNELIKEVSALEFEDSLLSSMSHVEVKAKELGFKETNSGFIALDLDAPIPVAVLPSQ